MYIVVFAYIFAILVFTISFPIDSQSDTGRSVFEDTTSSEEKDDVIYVTSNLPPVSYRLENATSRVVNATSRVVNATSRVVNVTSRVVNATSNKDELLKVINLESDTKKNYPMELPNITQRNLLEDDSARADIIRFILSLIDKLDKEKGEDDQKSEKSKENSAMGQEQNNENKSKREALRHWPLWKTPALSAVANELKEKETEIAMNYLQQALIPKRFVYIDDNLTVVGENSKDMVIKRVGSEGEVSFEGEHDELNDSSNTVKNTEEIVIA